MEGRVKFTVLRKLILKLRTSWRARLICVLLFIPLLVPMILHTVLKLMRLDSIWICDGYACSLDNYSDQQVDACRVINVNDVAYCTLASDCQGGQIDRNSEGKLSWKTTTESSIITFDLFETKSISALTMKGSAAVFTSRSREGQWKLLGRVSSESEKTFFFRPKSGSLLQLRTTTDQKVVISDIREDCYGCDWIPLEDYSSTCSTSDVSGNINCRYTFSKPTALSGFSVSSNPIQFDSRSYPISSMKVSIPQHPGNWSFMHLNNELSDTSIDQVLYMNTGEMIVPEMTKQFDVEIVVAGDKLKQHDTRLIVDGIKLGRTCTDGMLSDMEGAFTVHFAKAEERAKTQTVMSRKLRIQSEITSDWTRSRVLSEKDFVENLFNWPGAQTLEIGKPILKWVGTPVEVWVERRDNIMKTRTDTVTPQVLGAVACSMQHFKALQTILDRNLTYALITEDDGVIVKNFIPKFSKIMSKAPTDFDIIFVGGCLAKHAHPMGGVQVTPSLWAIKQHRCASSYVISRQAAEKLLHSEWPRYDAWMNIDPMYEYHMNSLIKNIYWAEPPLMFEGTKALFSVGQQAVRSVRLAKDS